MQSCSFNYCLHFCTWLILKSVTDRKVSWRRIKSALLRKRWIWGFYNNTWCGLDKSRWWEHLWMSAESWCWCRSKSSCHKRRYNNLILVTINPKNIMLQEQCWQFRMPVKSLKMIPSFRLCWFSFICLL